MTGYRDKTRKELRTEIYNLKQENAYLKRQNDFIRDEAARVKLQYDILNAMYENLSGKVGVHEG